MNAMALKSDGTVWVWGMQPTGTDYLAPTKVNTLDNIISIGAGGDGFYIALKNDGTVWTWGVNSHGELGDGNNNITEPCRVTPMKILGEENAPVQTATPAVTSIPSTISEGTSPPAYTVTPAPAVNVNSANTSTNTIEANGYGLELAGLAGIMLISCLIVYLWMTKRR